MHFRRPLPALALVAATACAQGGPRARDPGDEAPGAPPVHASVDSARELDQTGVRLFREGHFADAIRYFRVAYRMGGPPSELWNIARCRERLDDAEGAAHAIDEYLAQRQLAPGDRAEAEREVAALRSRPSLLTVTTSPSGATILLDGKPVPGATPLSVEIPAGTHGLTVRRDGYAVETRPLEARFGRAVIASVDLRREAR